MGLDWNVQTENGNQGSQMIINSIIWRWKLKEYLINAFPRQKGNND